MRIGNARRLVQRRFEGSGRARDPLALAGSSPLPTLTVTPARACVPSAVATPAPIGLAPLRSCAAGTSAENAPPASVAVAGVRLLAATATPVMLVPLSEPPAPASCPATCDGS